jgi:nicotinamide riboside transporter PnuC
MQKLYLKLNYFTKNELRLWAISVLLIVGSFFIFDKTNYLTLIASLIGTTSLIFNAKGNPFGQLLMIVFSVLYGTISLSFKYYGEMITYLGMTGPMALFALISWLKTHTMATSQKFINVKLRMDKSVQLRFLSLIQF